ncbi:MAG: hypothetical protein IPI95_08065 [Flavobacteriales bacterium]|nr:hypothetical protein [Flavobacteriales bacterium]
MPTSGLVAWCPLNNTAMDVGPNGHSGTTSGTTAAVDRCRNSVGDTAFAEPFCTFGAQDWIGFVGPGLAVEWIACPGLD